MLDTLKAVRRRYRRMVHGPEFKLWPETPYPAVRTTYWHPRVGVNFGDEISRIVVQLMLARRGYTPFDETAHERQLVTVGSVMHYASNDAVIWGTGVNGAIAERKLAFTRLDVRAVRGPRTRDKLLSLGIAAPEVYGDPALLLPHIAPRRFVRTPRHAVGFVPNLHDLGHLPPLPNGVQLISPLQAWNSCIDQILQCDYIVGSSLHALVIAEAYGIPARYVRLTPTEGIFKYHDYYEGTGRHDVSFATTVEEAMAMGGAAALHWDATPLLEAFPYDLWQTESVSALG